jgi:hypothetical protein
MGLNLLEVDEEQTINTLPSGYEEVDLDTGLTTTFNYADLSDESKLQLYERFVSEFGTDLLQEKQMVHVP